METEAVAMEPAQDEIVDVNELLESIGMAKEIFPKKSAMRSGKESPLKTPSNVLGIHIRNGFVKKRWGNREERLQQESPSQ